MAKVWYNFKGDIFSSSLCLPTLITLTLQINVSCMYWSGHVSFDLSALSKSFFRWKNTALPIDRPAVLKNTAIAACNAQWDQKSSIYADCHSNFYPVSLCATPMYFLWYIFPILCQYLCKHVYICFLASFLVRSNYVYLFSVTFWWHK